MRLRTIAALAVAGALTLTLAGCGPAFIREKLPASERGTEKRSRIETQAAQTAEVRLDMGVGQLRVSGGADTLMDADFSYRPSSWEPDVAYRVDGTRGVLTVEQPSQEGPNFGGNRNDWDVRLSDTVPLDLTIEQGVGQSHLRLGTLTLKTLKVHGGAGETTVDLTGTPRQDLSAEIESGVGEVTIKVPRDAGVRIFGVKDGVGDWKAEGFTQRGENEAVNAAWDGAKVRLDISVQRGVGSVRIEQQ